MNTRPASQIQSCNKALIRILIFVSLLLSTSMKSMATAPNNHQQIDNGDKVIRSAAVKYQDNAPQADGGRYYKELNEKQADALGAVKELVRQPLQRKTREEVMLERQGKYFSKAEAIDKGLAKGSTRSTAMMSNKTNLSNVQSASYYVSFDIYNATTRLFEDFDYDGFFQSFSVTFDADIYGPYAGELAYVFADLYLSKNGGPWELYHTTEEFAIVDDSSDDAFEVITNLELGYRTDHYDVLIDLYEVGYSDIVASISSKDVNSLYALPLESADADEYIEATSHSTQIIVGGGSFSASALLLFLCVIALRGLQHR